MSRFARAAAGATERSIVAGVACGAWRSLIRQRLGRVAPTAGCYAAAAAALTRRAGTRLMAHASMLNAGAGGWAWGA